MKNRSNQPCQIHPGPSSQYLVHPADVGQMDPPVWVHHHFRLHLPYWVHHQCLCHVFQHPSHHLHQYHYPVTRPPCHHYHYPDYHKADRGFPEIYSQNILEHFRLHPKHYPHPSNRPYSGPGQNKIDRPASSMGHQHADPPTYQK